jgi:hypothetical protein
VIESSDRARLTPESLAQLGRACLFRRQHLDRDVAIERQFVRQVHCAHATATQQSLNPILQTCRSFQSFA